MFSELIAASLFKPIFALSLVFREKVADGTVIVLKISTRANFADVHTKAISKVVFDTLSPFIVSRIESL